MIIGITGKMGSGKTLFMTYLAYVLSKEQNIISNYRLNFPHKIIKRSDILNYAQSKTQLKDCLLILDELQTIMDCRTSFKNKIATYFMLQTRKRNVDMAWTSQQFWNVEKRIRENTDLVFTCNPIREGKTLKKIMIDISRYEGRDTFYYLKTISLNNPEEYYKLYDSYEIVDFSE